MKPKRSQAAANCDRFEALIVGTVFSVMAKQRDGYRMAARYVKVGPDTVQADDGRQWPFGYTEGAGGRVILVPHGARSIADYEV